MVQATQAAFDGRVGLGLDPVSDDAAAVAGDTSRIDIQLSIHDELAGIEREWRAFERHADCTVFQSFDWVSTWQRCIGSLEGVQPVIVTGRDSRGQLLFLLPLGIETHGFARRLTWLGTELCDYNGPLLAEDFAKRVGAAGFKKLWRDIAARLQSDPRLWFDLVAFDKMQQTVGAQPNPFISLGVFANPNGAYLTRVYGPWDAFYADKRSSSTRRRDRTKRKKLGEFGAVEFVTPTQPGEVAATLDTLIVQKSGAFAAMGVANIFARPGHRAFYDALAAMRDLVHVSRLDVGANTAAANLGLIFRGSYYHLLASYDGVGEVSKFGPGAAHMHDLLRTAIERGCGVFDFTIGDERYKQEWSDSPITLYDHVSAARLRGIPVALRLKAVGRLKRWIKQTPSVWSVAEKVRAAIGPLRGRPRG